MDTVQHILDHQAVLSQAHRSCLGIFSLAKKYGSQRLENACQHIKVTEVVSYTILRNILSNNMDVDAVQSHQVSDNHSIPAHDNIRGASHINRVTNIFSIYKTFNTYHYEYTNQHPDDAIHETHRHG